MTALPRPLPLPIFVVLALVPATTLTAATATAGVTEGPFHPFNRSNTLPPIAEANRDNDLTRVAGATKPASGMPFLLSGTVRDLAGKPVPGVTIELWQTDDYGVYYHSGDKRIEKRDPNFQGYGECVTGTDGAYSFRTVKPGLYSGRVRHFHFKVKRGSETLLTSQFTFEDERDDFSKDGVQRRLSGDALESTVIAPTRGTDKDGAAVWVAQKDIVLDVDASPDTRGKAPRDRPRK